MAPVIPPEQSTLVKVEVTVNVGAEPIVTKTALEIFVLLPSVTDRL